MYNVLLYTVARVFTDDNRAANAPAAAAASFFYIRTVLYTFPVVGYERERPFLSCVCIFFFFPWLSSYLLARAEGEFSAGQLIAFA